VRYIHHVISHPSLLLFVIFTLKLSRDQDPFVLGDDDDDEVLSELPPYEEVAQNESQRTEATNIQDQKLIEPNQQNTDPTPLKYYLTPSDTLQGIALRYDVNVGNNHQLRSCK